MTCGSTSRSEQHAYNRQTEGQRQRAAKPLAPCRLNLHDIGTDCSGTAC